MAKFNFGGVEENVFNHDEFNLKKAIEILKNETLAILGYCIQGPGQALNLKDNGFNVFLGQRKGSASWQKAVTDGREEGKALFELEKACKRGTILMNLLSDAEQMRAWPTLEKLLTKGKTSYFLHG